jgi:hypothetical protein
MIVLAATGIKTGFAMRAGIVGGHVIFDAQLIAAYPAKNGFLVKFGFRPNYMLMICLFFMAGKARVILVTALELDGNDIQFGMPMHTAGLVVHRLAKDIDSPDLGDLQRFQYFLLSK